MVNWPHNKETRASQRVWFIMMSSFLSNYRSISTRGLLLSCIFTAWRYFPHFWSADCLIPVMCFSDCGVKEGLVNRNSEPMDSLQMLFSEGSKPSNAAEGQSLHHFRCRTPKPKGLRAPTPLHALPARTGETLASAPPWEQRSARTSESWYNALYRL